MENEPIQGSSRFSQEELDQKLIELDDFYGGYDPAFPEEFPIPRPSNLLEKDKSKQLTTKMSSRPLTMRENLNESVKEKLIDDFNTSESFAELLANTAIGTTKKMGLADFSPAGIAFGIQESIKGYKEASYADDTAGQILSAIGLPLSVISGLPLTAMGTKGAINLAKKLKVARAKVHGVDFGGTVGNASMVAMTKKAPKSMAMVKPKQTDNFNYLREGSTIKIDNPSARDIITGETYVAKKIRENKPFVTEKNPIGGFGGTTGFVDNIKFNPKELINFKGAAGEEKYRMAGLRMENLKKSIAEKGYLKGDEGGDRILIHVTEDGTPYITEGNHRLAEAFMSKRPFISADIRYLRGGEAVDGPLNPKKIGIGTGKIDSTKEVPPLEIGVSKFALDGKLKSNLNKDSIKLFEDKAKGATAGSSKANKLIGVSVKDGEKVGIRKNLNSKSLDGEKGVLQTIHQNNYNGKALSYQPYATVENVIFNVNQSHRRRIASKAKGLAVPESSAKFNMASVDGNYVSNKNLLRDGYETEIAFNPAQGHLFIDVNTGQAVKGAKTATVVGDRVFANGVTYWKKADAPKPLDASDGTKLTGEVRYKFKAGGLVKQKGLMAR